MEIVTQFVTLSKSSLGHRQSELQSIPDVQVDIIFFGII